MTNDTSTLLVPEQHIPVPSSVSPQAQAWLAQAGARAAARLRSDGSVAPLSTAASAEQAITFLKPLADGFRGQAEAIELQGGAPLYCITPAQLSGPYAQAAYLDIHGGGFVAGGGELCRIVAKLRAMEYGVRVYSVDYRLAPRHPFPAGLDDCVAAYREVLKHCDPRSLVLGGASAGANLAAALMHRLREEGLPFPCALLLQTAAVDLTESGDTHHTNKYLDLNLYGGGGEGPRQYLGSADPRDPFVSPLFGNVDGWPPTILTTGTRDLLLSDTVRMHRTLRRAGVRAELHVAEASPHGGFMGAGAPEDGDLMLECRRFVNDAWGLGGMPA